MTDRIHTYDLNPVVRPAYVPPVVFRGPSWWTGVRVVVDPGPILDSGNSFGLDFRKGKDQVESRGQQAIDSTRWTDHGGGKNKIFLRLESYPVTGRYKWVDRVPTGVRSSLDWGGWDGQSPPLQSPRVK